MTTMSAPAEMPARRTASVAFSLTTVGLISVVTAAWGGIIPYVGPIFGFSADGTSSWTWNLSHAVLALIPGAVALVMGFTLLTPVRTVGLRRAGLATAGMIMLACGAWFVIGPVAWPVLTNSPAYFVSASPLMNLAHQIGSSFGPGVILAGCGAYAIGWASRHREPFAGTGTTTNLVQPTREDKVA